MSGLESINIALLTEGEMLLVWGFYKHSPPDGGRIVLGLESINMALLTEGELGWDWNL